MPTTDPEKRRAQARARYQKNREKVLDRVAKYRAKNPEKVRASVKRWKAKNPEKVKEQRQRYVEVHRDELNEKARQRYIPHPRVKQSRDKLSAADKKWRAANPEKVRRHWSNNKINQIKRLTDSYIRDLLGYRKGECPQELIEVKRAHLMLKRAIKEQE